MTFSDTPRGKEIEQLDSSPEADYNFVPPQREQDEDINDNLDQSMELNDPNQVRAILKNEAKLNRVAKEIFDEVDTDHSGAIDRSEMRNAMKMFATEMGIAAPTESDVNKAMSEFDSDGSGKLNVDEFRAVVVEILKAIIEE